MREWGRRVRGAAALAVAAAVAAGAAVGTAAAGSAAEEIPVVELPKAACDVCSPGKPPPPPEVQERVRRINQGANWREQRPEGDTIPLGTQTRIWLQRAWASGRLQPGVAAGGSVAPAVQPAFRSAAPSARRNSLAERSRARLSDRRSTRDERRGSSRSRRGQESAGASGSSRDSRSSFGSDGGSSFGTGRQSGLFGSGGTLGEE